MNYKFNKEEHLHQLEVDGEWKNLTGTSSATGVIGKGGLTWWASGLAVAEFGWTPKKKKDGKYAKTEERLKAAEAKLVKLKKLEKERYLEILDNAYAAHSKKLDSSATAGTDLHAEVEKYIRGEMEGNPYQYDEQIKPFVIWAKQNVDKFLWSEMHCYSEKHWVGGISDAGYIDKNGEVGILDIKSSKDAYANQFIQCAGYDIQISENGGYTADGDKIFDLEGKKITHYTVFPFGMTKPTGVQKFNVEELKEGFVAAVCLYRLTN
jgi:hypothetical protein